MLADRKKINYNNLNSNKYNNTEDKKENSILPKKYLGLYILIILILGLIFVFLINQSLIINEMNSKVNTFENELNEIQQENKNLRVEIGQKTSLSQIENIARNKLGMVNPEKTRVMVMGKDGIDNSEISGKNNLQERKKIGDLLKDFWQSINVARADELLE